MFKLKTLSQVVAATVAASFLAGCGSGSSSGSASSDTTDVTGSVFASYVAGAKVLVEDVNGNPIAGPVMTATNGQFIVPVPNANLGGGLVFVATGGAYVDEATGSAGTSSERLSVYAPANTLGGKPSISATPASSLIERLIVKYGMPEADAKNAFELAFGYQPDMTVKPVDATQDNSGASIEAKLAGVRAAAFSQLLKNVGLEAGDHKALLDALAEDLADGVADGMNGSTPVQLKGGNIRQDMASQFSVALVDFANDLKNKSGMTPGKVGLITFSPKAESDSYYFELAPKGMVKSGKVTFDLTIKDPATEGSPSTPQVGLQPKITPTMYMEAGHMHSTPHGGCTVTNNDGVAECTVYFLMPSVMANGGVMGNWDLKFSVGTGADEESVHFFPKVMMAMGNDTGRLMLMGDKTDTDFITDSDNNPASRSYFIYKNAVMGTTGNHTVKFFVATKDSMMSFPAVDDTGAVSGPMNSSVILKVGPDANNLVAATSLENGVWSATVDNLTDGALGTVYVELTVDGFTKKSNGNSVLPFKVTPGSM